MAAPSGSCTRQRFAPDVRGRSQRLPVGWRWPCGAWAWSPVAPAVRAGPPRWPSSTTARARPSREQHSVHAHVSDGAAEAPQIARRSRCAAATVRSRGSPSGRAHADGPWPLHALRHSLAPGSPVRRYGRLSAHPRLGSMLNGACPPAGGDRGGGGTQKLGGCCGQATPWALSGPGSRLLRESGARSPDRVARPLARWALVGCFAKQSVRLEEVGCLGMMDGAVRRGLGGFRAPFPPPVDGRSAAAVGGKRVRICRCVRAASLISRAGGRACVGCWGTGPGRWWACWWQRERRRAPGGRHHLPEPCVREQACISAPSLSASLAACTPPHTPKQPAWRVGRRCARC